MMNTATNDAANTVSYQLRGNPALIELFREAESESGVTTISIDDERLGDEFESNVGVTINERIHQLTDHNAYILFGETEEGEEIPMEPDVDGSGEGRIALASSEEECDDFIKSDRARVSCAYLYVDRSDTGNERASSYQIVVRSKAPFRFVGNFFSVLSGSDGEDDSIFSIYGNSSSPIEMPGRFNYN